MHYQIKQREDELRGIEEGRKDGIAEGKAAIYYTDLHLSINDIAQRLSISTKDVERLLSSQGLLPNPT